MCFARVRAPRWCVGNSHPRPANAGLVAAQPGALLGEKLAGPAFAFHIFHVAIRIPVPRVPQPPYGTHIRLSEAPTGAPIP